MRYTKAVADTTLLREALTHLGVDRFVLGIHDASFPSDDGADVGRGSPYSRRAHAFYGFASSLGFNGIQLGPQGITHRGSASPYEGTLFSRNPQSLPLPQLVRDGLLSQATVDELVSSRPEQAPERMPYAYVFSAYERITRELFDRYRAHAPDELRTDVQRYLSENAHWLLPDALYDCLCAEHGREYFRDWGHTEQGRFDERLFAPGPGEEALAHARLNALRTRCADAIEKHALVQLLLDRAHARTRERLRELGLLLYGDLQVGLSAQDDWAYQALFLRGYRMGAPPSRTNPDGQPWGYTVLDPEQYGSLSAPGPALQFVRARARRMLDGFDGVRVDHPHGWIDPWVYSSTHPDALHAVQNGARLFSSPDLPDHLSLASFAIARPEQLDRTRPRYADNWVTSLDPVQVERYALQIDTIVDEGKKRGLPPGALVCEILSTQPYPVAAVLKRHQLGRFRVTQKASLENPADVYRSENAEPQDWIMLGNHDTPTIWRVIDGWASRGELPKRAGYLAHRLSPPGAPAQDVEAFSKRLEADRGLLANAQLADALSSRARNVFVFFADLFGMREVYNSPGTTGLDNWSLRAPSDFERSYEERAKNCEALDLPLALSMALRSRDDDESRALAQRLESNGIPRPAGR